MRISVVRLVSLCIGSCVAAQAFAAEFDCVIEPREVIELRAPLEGLIERVTVDRGDFVRKGQAVAVLDTAVEEAQAAIALYRSQMQGAVAASRSRVEFSARKARRVEELHRDNYISAQARDEAATEKALAEAELLDASDNRMLAQLEYKRQQAIIRLKTIRSPINGVVIERMLNPGEFAEAGVGRKPLMKLAEIDVLHVEVILPVEAYGRVQPGAAIEVVPEIPAGTRYKAKVKVIDRVLDAASGTFGVRLELINRERKIPAGIRCKAIFPNVPGSSARLRVPFSPSAPQALSAVQLRPGH